MNNSIHDFMYNDNLEEGSGLKGAIDQKTANLIVKYFDKEIKKKITELKVENQYLSLNYIGCSITNLNFGISNYSYQKVKVYFEPRDKIHIYLSDLIGWGIFETSFNILVASKKEIVNFQIKNINIISTLKIKTKKQNDKLLPDAEITKLHYDYDFDFELSSNLGNLLLIFKNQIKNLIKQEINRLINKEINHGLQIGISMIPNEIVIDKKKGYVIDYSLISTPYIENNYILFNSYARFINKNIKETLNKNNYFLPLSIPSYDLIGKSSQIYISDYVINTALFTFFKTKDLEIFVTPDMLPENLPLIKLSTSWLGIIFKDMSDVFGADMPVTFKFIVCENPQLILKEKFISFILPTNIEVIVQGFQGIAVKFRTTFFVDVVLKVFENCKISGKIENLNIQNTKVIWSYTDDKNFAKNIEDKFNFLKGLALPFINIFVLKNIDFKLPVIKGIKFTDMTISHHENFIIVNYNFSYNEN